MKKKLLIFLFTMPVMAFAQTGIITTVAGDGMAIYAGDGGLATAASVGLPGDIDFDSLGNYYFSQRNNTVRKVSASGIISTIAGSGTTGFGGDGGAATLAKLASSDGIGVDRKGNVYIADENNHRIRKVDVSTGVITTIAGKGTAGFSGDNGPATDAELNSPFDVAVDNIGNLYISDYYNLRIRKIDNHGIITTVIGTGVYGHTGDGGPATSATIDHIYSLCVDVKNNLYIGDGVQIRKMDVKTEIITTIAGNGTSTSGGDGGPASLAGFIPRFLTISNAGDVYIGDLTNNNVRVVDNSGIIHLAAGNSSTTFSGDGGPATVAGISSVRGVATDVCGNLFIVDNGSHRIRKVTIKPACDPTTVSVPVLQSEQGIAISPNPVNDILHLDNVQNKSTYRVLTMLGTVLQQGVLHPGSSSISTRSLPAGIYMFDIGNSEGQRTITKIVKQ